MENHPMRTAAKQNTAQVKSCRVQNRNCGRGQMVEERAGSTQEIVHTQNMATWPFRSLGRLQLLFSPRTDMKQSPEHKRWRYLSTLQTSVHSPSVIRHEASSHGAGWAFDLTFYDSSKTFSVPFSPSISFLKPMLSGQNVSPEALLGTRCP